ncbi:protein phosphatase 2C 26 like [Verticillium longisporum]|nr:protein phosphatase 2C 26 like [Verticillium longisporum]
MVLRPKDEKVIYKTKEQWHWFDCPRQLGTNSPDTPEKNAVMDKVEVRVGDVILAMSDGVIDNMWEHEIVHSVRNSLARWENGEGGKVEGDRTDGANGGMKFAAEELVTAAKVVALDPFAERPGIAGFSHHQATTKEEDKEDEKEEDLGWQEMPSYAPYDIYDDDNKLVAKEHTEEDEAKEAYGYGGLGGAGRGYTRVIMDDDAESATSMDDNTKYLFKEVNGTSLTEEQDEQRDAVSQMQATKDLLTEGQRVAYVGLVRIEIFQLVRAAETIEQTRNSKKWVTLGAEATKMWGQKMMIRVTTDTTS